MEAGQIRYNFCIYNMPENSFQLQKKQAKPNETKKRSGNAQQRNGNGDHNNAKAKGNEVKDRRDFNFKGNGRLIVDRPSMY